MPGFQGVVNQYPAFACAGDFASANPRANVTASQGYFIAGAGSSGTQGANIGYFGWADANGNVLNQGTGSPTGFIHRDLQGLMFNLLSEATINIPPGFPVTLFNSGDFWVKTTTPASPGQAVFASIVDGSVITGTAGSPPATAAVTGTIAGEVLTVTAVTSGTLIPGAEITGAGVTPGTHIISQTSGTTGGIGVYALDTASTVASSETITQSAYVATKFSIPAGFSCAEGELAIMSTWN
jgi:hypothetical protein